MLKYTCKKIFKLSTKKEIWRYAHHLDDHNGKIVLDNNKGNTFHIRLSPMWEQYCFCSVLLIIIMTIYL